VHVLWTWFFPCRFAHRTTNTVYDEVLIVVVSDADLLDAGVFDGG